MVKKVDDQPGSGNSGFVDKAKEKKNSIAIVGVIIALLVIISIL